MTKDVSINYKNQSLKHLLVNLFLLCFTSLVSAQDSPKANIHKLISAANAFNNNLAVEKLYLQTDKPSYFAGDTLWLKGYLFNASYWDAATKSGVLYIEIANDSNQVMKRTMLPVFSGLAFGYIELNPKELPKGGYVLRAYTNWMRNFGEDYIFKKHIYLGDATDKDWLIDYNAQILKEGNKDKIHLALKFNRFNTTPLGLRTIQIRITDERKTWFKDKAETTIDGMLDINFNLPEKADSKHLTLNMQDMRTGENNHLLTIPLLLNRPENLDVQFMPEGGNLVANLAAHVAFKAIGEDGMGKDITGKVYNSKLQEVTEFHSTHSGMGTFEFTPQANESYSAKIDLPNGSFKTLALPKVANTGIVLKVDNQFERDSCRVIVNATPDVAADGTYTLIGQARGVVLYGASFNFKNGPVTCMVNKKIFPTGIVRFILIGPGKNAVNERIAFIDHHDKLNIRLTSDKPSYRQRDPVVLDMQVSDKNGTPVQGSFSLAVTDDGQVTTDSIQDGSIVTYMLLTSDLKGNIEDPGYYFQSTDDVQKWQHLDQLLLTQGWIGYDWGDIFKPSKKFEYNAEPEYLIKGKVTNMFNKPVAGSGISLLSKNPFFVMDTITNDQGIFTFRGVVPVDTAVFFIQSRNKKGKSFNVGIEMDEFKPPVFTAVNKRVLPWYVNIDINMLTFVKKQVQLKQEQERITGGIMLKEVIVKGKKIIKDSKNLNGAGEADIIVDEQELEKAGKTTLGDQLENNIKGFGPRADKYGNRFYVIYDKFVHLIIDGMDIDFFQPEGISPYEYFKQYLDYYDAEEIKGIEVMKSSKYTGKYVSRYLPPLAEPFDFAFVEITTRGGRGPFVKKSVGTYLYKPTPFTLPKSFYSPTYIVNSTPDMTDIRSTIYWESNILTDKNGKATVTFYTADNPGSYSITMEGSDMEGNLGVKREKIMVISR